MPDDMPNSRTSPHLEDPSLDLVAQVAPGGEPLTEPGVSATGADVVVAVLAAGHGKRMQSDVPKHLLEVAGMPIIERVIRAGIGARTSQTFVMVGSNMADLEHRLNMHDVFTLVVQGPPKGTADSVRQALMRAGDASWIVSLLGDSPHLTSEVVDALVERARSSRSKVTLLTCMVDDASAYGRIERDHLNRIVHIVELKNDEPNRRHGRTEINSGVMVLDAAWAHEELARLSMDTTTGEFLLTDLVDAAVRGGAESDGAWPVQAHVADASVSLGVNDRMDLSESDARARQTIRERHIRNGVTIIGPDTVFIDERVVIGEDTVIAPHSILTGTTVIGRRCEIGPAAVLHNARLDDGVVVEQSTVRDSGVGSGTHIGPYAHLRGGCHIGQRVHIGSFAEMKNATLADGVKCGHVSYLGDVSVGEATNIGAGTITANYDGESKHATTIGEGVFIGSDSILVAPIHLGDRARTGAGSVVNRDVEPGVTVVGVPARPIGGKDNRRRQRS